MQITVEAGDITQSEAPCIVVNLFEGITVPGGATGAASDPPRLRRPVGSTKGRRGSGSQPSGTSSSVPACRSPSA